MAKNRNSGTSLAIPGRWVGGGAVALIHLAFLLALLTTDRLTFHKPPDARPMTVYRLPDEARPTPAPPAIGSPSRPPAMTSVVTTPRLDGPMILLQPDKPTPIILTPGLTVTTKPGQQKIYTQDDLLPSKEKQLKKFFTDSAEENRLAREPAADKDCKAVVTAQKNAASLGSEAFKDPLPIEEVCTPTGSAKELSKRNDRFAPK